MSMYALQVMTGMEAEITQKLRGKGVDARCPQERRMIRRGGKWQEQLYTLFPSYIFVSTPDVYRVYYDTTYYADLQRAFDSFMRQLWELFGPVLRVRKNKRIVSHPQPHRVGKYHAPHLRPDPHPHLPRDRLQEYHSEPEIPPEGSCSRADEAQDDSDTDNTDEGDHL